MATGRPDEQTVFDAARRIASAPERSAFLSEACGGDGGLRARVEALLGVYDKDCGFLEPGAPAITGAGTVIGPYRLVGPLGEGGMGTVYLAEQAEPVRRQVALKIIKPGLDSRQVLARFEAERQALALMDHPNIAKVFDGGATAAGRPYFVMELVRGAPITRYSDDRRLTPRQRLELFLPVCRAVQHAHQKGVIHRDLKPGNVLVAEDDGRPVPKVIDFGVAKAAGARLTDATLETALGTVVGTLEYMSPEQAEPGQLDIDTRTDVYSLGVVLYELLTGTTPLDRKRLKQAAILEMLRVVREEEPPRPSTRVSTVEELPSVAANRGVEPRKLTSLLRGDLDWIVMKSLEKDRARRYPTASGLAQDIERYLNEQPVEACPPSATYRLGKFARRHKAALAAAAACLALLVAGAVVSTWQAVRATAAEKLARENEARALAALERADEEAAISRAVNNFLENDLLGQADIANQPAGNRDPNITVRELLDRAARNVDARFRGQDRTETSIRMTLGKAYASVGEYAKAQEHIDRSLALLKQTRGDGHADTLECMSAAGKLCVWRGRFTEAEALFKNVLEAREAALGPDHAATVNALSDLGKFYGSVGQVGFAEERLGRVLEYRRANQGDKHPDTLDTLRCLGLLFNDRNRFDQAEPLLRQSLDGYRKLWGADHPLAIAVAGSLARGLVAARRHREAEPVLREVIDVCRVKHGPDHPTTLRLLFDLAEVCRLEDRLAESGPLYEQVLAGFRVKLGADHRDTISALANLAVVYDLSGRFQEAEPLFKQVLAVRQAANPRDETAVVNALVNLGKHYSDHGRLDDAESTLKEAVETGRKKLSPVHALTQTAEGNLAILWLMQKKPALAEPVFRDLAELQRTYAKPDDPLHARTLAWLAKSLLDQSKYAEAETAARTSLAIQVKTEPDLWTTFETRTLLGAALAGQKKYAEAEPLLVGGYEGMKQRESRIPARERDDLTAALQRVIQLYEAWGKPAQAERWRMPPAP